MSNEDERTTFSFRVKKDPSGGQTVVAHLQFVEQQPLKRYPVIILQEGDLLGSSGEQAQVPGNLGKAEA